MVLFATSLQDIFYIAAIVTMAMFTVLMIGTLLSLISLRRKVKYLKKTAQKPFSFLAKAANFMDGFVSSMRSGK